MTKLSAEYKVTRLYKSNQSAWDKYRKLLRMMDDDPEVAKYVEIKQGKTREEKDREAADLFERMFFTNKPKTEWKKPEPVEREPKGIDPGYVYLLRCSDTPYYKIGRTKQKDPEVRIRAIQGICPMEIVKLKVKKTGNVSSLEKYLHRQYKDRHHRYEWYTFKSKAEAERLFKEGIDQFEKWRKGEQTW